jgi:hypothetical protein
MHAEALLLCRQLLHHKAELSKHADAVNALQKHVGEAVQHALSHLTATHAAGSAAEKNQKKLAVKRAKLALQMGNDYVSALKAQDSALSGAVFGAQTKQVEAAMATVSRAHGLHKFMHNLARNAALSDPAQYLKADKRKAGEGKQEGGKKQKTSKASSKKATDKQEKPAAAKKATGGKRKKAKPSP